MRHSLPILALAAATGCVPVHSRWLGPYSDHFDGQRFHDPARARRGPDLGDLLAWRLTARPADWDRPADTAPGPRPPATVREGVRVTWVGHATLLVQMDGVNVLTDPIWSDRGSPFPSIGPRRIRPPALRFDELPRIDAVVVSHDHYDHMDLPTLRRLAARHRPHVLVPLNDAGFLAGAGVPSGVDLDWWQCVRLGPVTACLVPARHGTARGASDRDRSLWGGWWLSGPSGSVFFAGDTAWGPHFAEIRRRMGAPCVALLPIGAYRPRWFMRAIHMDPAEAVRAYQALGARHGVAMHWGTFDLSDESRLEPVEDLARAVARRRVTGFAPVPFGQGRVFSCR